MVVTLAELKLLLMERLVSFSQPENMLFMAVQLSAFHLLRSSRVTALQCQNMWAMLLTRAVSVHPLTSMVERFSHS